MTTLTLEELKIREREARRDLIVTAAQSLFSVKDFRQVTAREIAKTAQVSPGTIYRYYRNLDDLFIDIFLNHAQQIAQLIDVEYQEAGECTVERFCEIYITYLNENMTFYQMMSHFMLNGELPPDTSHKVDPTMRILMDGVERILIDAGSSHDSRIGAHALFSALNGTMISYARYPGRSLAEIKNHTLRLAKAIAERFNGE